MASKRARRRSGCEGKIRYQQSEDAWAARRRYGVAEVYPYKCPFGGADHELVLRDEIPSHFSPRIRTLGRARSHDSV